MDLFGKVMSLLFNMLSRLVITFLPKTKRLLISWLQSPSAVILEPKKIKSDTVSPSISMKWWDRMPWSSFSECWALRQLFHFPLLLNPNSANFLCRKHFLHKQVSDNNPSHGLKLWPMCSSCNILCKDPWTNVNGYFIDYFLGTTAEGSVLSHASLKNNKHLNILSSQLNWRKERTSQNHKA